MPVIKCKMCGGDMELSPDKTFGTCEYCGSTMTLPKVDDEQRAAAFNRGNHFRRIGEFDKALSVYERIVREDETDAEAHWCCALCRFGIEYVEDPATYEWLPTCHRASFDSFLEDVDYLAALKYSDGITRRQYQRDGVKIAEVQRGILATSQNEEPFDVFLCYKESDDSGNRTVDSTLAQDIYYQLTNQGRRVFFARITLEDKAGAQYEPYIFAALNSAKVMIAVGTRPEYFNAVWVKNEWSRFLSLMKKDRSKLLLPCYRDMDPYDLPEQLSVLQSYDMGKIGFLQDLIRGVNKVLDADKQPEPAKETVVVQSSGGANLDAVMKRGRMALEDGEWAKADQFWEEVLNQDAECAEAYTGKLMASTQCRTLQEYIQKQLTRTERADSETLSAAEPEEERIHSAVRCYAIANYLEEKQIVELYAYDLTYPSVLNCRREQAEKAKQDFEDDKLLRRAFRFAKGAYKEQLETIKRDYFAALDARIAQAEQEDSARIAEIRAAYAEHLDKVDADVEALSQTEQARRESGYRGANQLMADGRYEEALAEFESLGSYEDSTVKIKECKAAIQENTYQKALTLKKQGKGADALSLLDTLDGYQDTEKLRKEILADIRKNIAPYQTAISASAFHTVGLKSDGTVVAVGPNHYGPNHYGQSDVTNWRDIVAVSASSGHTVGLKSDGTVVAVGKNDYGQFDVTNWRDIVAVSADGCHTVGLKSDGTVVAVGWNDDGQCDVADWRDIVAVSAGWRYTVGLKADGTVVAVGSNKDWKGNHCDQCEVSGWTDIVAVSAGGYHTVGLKSDGTVVARGKNDDRQCNVSDWRDIVAVSAGSYHTMGLKSDGTVVAVGKNNYGQCDVTDWRGIAAVPAQRRWKWDNRCQYCGGTFKGLFTRKCAFCGHVKDY